MKNLSDVRLAWDLAVRDQRAAFKRTVLGLLWVIMTPLILLVIYTLVFGIFLGIKWTTGTGIEIGYALPMFMGLVIYLLFSDLISSSTGLLISKRSFVLKAAFPLWVLILSNFMRSTISFCASLVLVYLLCLFSGLLSIQGLLFSLVIVVQSLLFLFALSFILSVMGPFVGDLSQGLRLGMRVFFYASPITYPMLIVPEKYQVLLWMNPLTLMIEPFRNAVLYQESIFNIRLTLFTVVTLLLLTVAYWMYGRVRGVLADVV